MIADRLAIFVNSVYGSYETKSGSMLLVATIFGAFQLYCDFSGCMDMARGFSEIIGIDLEKNFNHPFFSESAAEFWRRWHITLGTWFKDYVYMPISVAPWMMKFMGKVKNRFGMSAAKNVSTVVSLSIVWILTGVWHGTGLNYVAWGVYWGLLIILGMLLTPTFGKVAEKLHINTDSNEWHFFRKIRTFFLFLISRVFTIPSNLEASMQVFHNMIFKFDVWELVDGTVYKLGLDRPNFILAIITLILLYFVSRYEETNGKVRDWIAERQIVLRWMILYGLMFSIIIFGIYGPGYDASKFVYMQY
jgi:D-alanyl-lipoteichoic acid acyltransferase DltB (MBOAT superfamily)